MYIALMVAVLRRGRRVSGRLVRQSPPAADRYIRTAEEGVSANTDGQHHAHHCHQTRGVGELPGELQLRAERWLVGHDDDELTGHEAAPCEGPPLLETGDER